MSYSLDKNKSIDKNIQVIASVQIDRAISEINDQSLDIHETIHRVRKRCKKIRGLIRLVRKVFPNYKEENARYRDAAGALSEVRDAQAVILIFDKLMNRPDCKSEQDSMKPVLHFLEERQKKQMKEKEVYVLLQDTELLLREGIRRTTDWQLEAGGIEAIEGGFKKTYKRAGKAMKIAYEEPDMDNFHEWRKRVKYHWYHSRLITPLWENMFAAYSSEVHQLSDYLGDEHDLGLFRKIKEEIPADVLKKNKMNAMNGFLDDYQQELRNKARLLGAKVFSLKPKWRQKQLEALWPTRMAAGNLHELNK